MSRRLLTHSNRVRESLGLVFTVVLGIAIIGYPGYQLMTATNWGKRKRLHYKSKRAPEQVELNIPSYVGQSSIESDVRYEVGAGLGGVRIVWSGGEAAKTQTIKYVVGNLLIEKKLSGCIYVDPLTDPDASAVELLELATTDFFGPIITRKDRLSEILGHEDKPFVLIFEVEGIALEERGLEALVRALAYDSDAHKSYLTLLVTSDTHLAKKVSLWNGGTKITFLGSHSPP